PKLLPLIVTSLATLILGYAFIEALERVRDIIAPLFIPLLISLWIAYLLEPLVEVFEKRKLSRSQSSILSIFLAGLLLIAILLFLVPSFWFQLSDIIDGLPEKLKAAGNWIQGRLAYLEVRNPSLYQQISQQVDEFMHDPSAVTAPIGTFVKNAVGQIGSLTASILNLILIPLFVYYILVDFKLLTGLLGEAVPPRNREIVSDFFRQVDVALRNFVRGQLLVCLAMSFLYVIGFLLLGVPMGLTLGILSGFGHLIPYFGTGSAAVLVILFSALDNPEWWRIIAIIAIYPIVQATEGFLLTPRILGDKLELHPFLVLAGVIVGHHLFGILGIVLAAPVMACGKILLSFIFRKYLSSSFYNRTRTAPEEKLPEQIIEETERASTEVTG
ncbi:MAG: AI-2E family transporter, partial [Blastocatellia bacterium]|nr:AI-2E family transporter [Blastocatellia bacterium]